MDFFESSINSLDPPWNLRINSILVDPIPTADVYNWPSVMCSFAFITDVSPGNLTCEMGFHEPFEGPKLIRPKTICTINCPECIDILQGSWVGFSNAMVVSRDPPKLHLDQKSAIWVLSTLEASCGTVTGHLFSGAFSGWERAFDWCSAVNINKPMFSYAIDSDSTVAKIWAKNEDVKVFHGLIPLNFKTNAMRVMFNTTVQGTSWYNVNRFFANLLITASPPCQSWSLGGKQTGLHSENGVAFIESIKAIKWNRPIAFLLECSDRVPSHKHFEIIKLCLSFAGYKQHWSQVVALDSLTGMARTRWLGVWLRHDIFPHDSPPPIKLVQVSPRFWNDEECRFFIPETVKQQLWLNHDLLGFYGNFDLLPPNKKVDCGFDPSNDRVLNARCLSPTDKMPTLCAQYSKQHDLSRTHLCKKGLFASIMKCDGKFMFFDPLRFVNLLGNPKDQICVLSNKIDDAFHHLGNAISVQHALLAIKVALLACGFDKSPIMESITFSWQDRMTKNDVVIIEKENCLFMTPFQKIQKVISSNHVKEHDGCNIPIYIDDKSWFISKQCTFGDFFIRIGITEIKEQGLCIRVGEVGISPEDPIIPYAGRPIDVLKGNVKILSLQVPFEIAFPTQSWNHCPTEIDQALDEEIIDHVRAIESESHEQKLPMQEIVYFVLGQDNPSKIFVPNQITEQEIIAHILQHLGSSATPENIQWFSSMINFQNSRTLAFALDPSFICKHPNKCIFVQTASDAAFPIIVSNEVAPLQIAHRCNIPASIAWKNHEFAQIDNVIQIQHGDSFHFQHDQVSVVDSEGPLYKRPKVDRSIMTSCDDARLTRLLAMDKFGPKLGTDEMMFLIDHIRSNSKNQDFKIGNFCYSEKGLDFTVCSKISQIPNCNDGTTFVFPVLFPEHWGAIEVSKDSQGLAIRAININNEKGCKFINRFLKVIPSVKRIQHFVIPAIDGFCGWALLSKWCHNAQAEIPDASQHEAFDRIFSSFGKNHMWGKISSFALKARTFFIATFPHESHDVEIRFGGAEDEPMQGQNKPQTPQETDPWLKFDPWSSKQKQCRWEDLSLPEDHPFHDPHDHRIRQVHRHALNANNNGIAFCTRAAVNEILTKQPKQPFALVVPVSDKVAWQPPQGANASQPLELIVQDRLSDATYKRQVIIVQTDKQVQVKMPKPGFTTTLTEKHEVVLEMFSMLLPKELQNHSNDRHPSLLKSRAIDQFPILQRENINIYGFRKFQDQVHKERVTLQAMCKVTKEARILMLETSGAGDVFVRDYISKGMQPVDTTIIPKFWPSDRQGKDEALRSSATIDGFSGIVVTRRGIATRAWCDRVSNVRKVLLANDERICELNLAVVPHHMYNSTGWPLSIGPNDIVKVVAKTCGLPPIPTRCFKTLGVTSWTLGFQSTPTTLKFTAQFNGIIHEILLTKVEEMPMNKKQGKSNTKPFLPKPFNGNNDSTPAAQSTDSDERLTSLETKVAAMERRQDGMEHKLQTGFDGIQDQLRQVLNAVQPRPASPRVTGFTPPPKVAKSSS